MGNPGANTKTTHSKKPRKPMGRPPKQIDFDLLDDLCKIQCTEAEICAILDVTDKTLVDRIHNKTGQSFSEYYAQKSSGGKRSLRRRQFQTAMGIDPVVQDGVLVSKGTDPNPTMLIWLGKQYLRQSDKTEVQHSGELEVRHDLSKLDDAELRTFKALAEKTSVDGDG